MGDGLVPEFGTVLAVGRIDNCHYVAVVAENLAVHAVETFPSQPFLQYAVALVVIHYPAVRLAADSAAEHHPLEHEGGGGREHASGRGIQRDVGIGVIADLPYHREHAPAIHLREAAGIPGLGLDHGDYRTYLVRYGRMDIALVAGMYEHDADYQHSRKRAYLRNQQDGLDPVAEMALREQTLLLFPGHLPQGEQQKIHDDGNRHAAHEVVETPYLRP